jgi:Flp pilus assembly protein TadD
MDPEQTAPAAPAPQPVLPRYTRAEYARAQAIVIPRYVRMMFLPAGQNLDPDVTPPVSAADPRVLGFLALAAGAAAVAWRFRRSPPVLLGGVLLAGALAPTSSIVPAADLMAEHRAYVPLVAFCIALIPAFARLRVRAPGPAAALLAGLLVALTAATFRRNAVWDTELSLWTDVVAKSPGKERPHLNLGLALLRDGRPREAEREVRRALEIRPDYAFARNNLGNLLRRRGEAAEAEEQYLAAIRARPGYAEPYVNLGNLAADRGDWTAAEARYREALAIRPGARDAAYNLAKALESQGRLPEAIARYEELVRRFPGDALLPNDLGCARLLAGDAAGAERDLRRATEIRGDWEVAWYNLGLALEAGGDRDGAIRALETALSLEPALEPARRRLAGLKPD